MAARTQTPRPGRPRDPNLDKKILENTRKLMASDGFMRMTVDAVAQATGVTRPTIYLRWPTKDQLVIAAIEDIVRPNEVNLTGDCRQDLISVVWDVKLSFFDHGNAGLIGAITSERKHSPKLFEAFVTRLMEPRRRSISLILEHAIEKGTVRPDINVDATVSALIGSLYAKIIAGQVPESSFVEGLVDVIWGGVAAKDTASGDN